jgi:hypothetical protein
MSLARPSRTAGSVPTHPALPVRGGFFVARQEDAGCHNNPRLIVVMARLVLDRAGIHARLGLSTET